jgi:hypothetical protein
MRISLALVVFASLVSVVDTAKAEYSFQVTNSTKSTVTKLEVSEDGKEWGAFNVGDGIHPGETATITWDKSTDNEDCKQKIRATYADQSKTEVSEFDFCEDALHIEFN